MARYITTDTATGEVVAESQRYPRAVPLARQSVKRRLSLLEAWERLELKTKAVIVAAALLALLTR